MWDPVYPPFKWGMYVHYSTIDTRLFKVANWRLTCLLVVVSNKSSWMVWMILRQASSTTYLQLIQSILWSTCCYLHLSWLILCSACHCSRIFHFKSYHAFLISSYLLSFFLFFSYYITSLLLLHLFYLYYREHIVKTISNNRVVVVSGDTGCGKQTVFVSWWLESFDVLSFLLQFLLPLSLFIQYFYSTLA